MKKNIKLVLFFVCIQVHTSLIASNDTIIVNIDTLRWYTARRVELIPLTRIGPWVHNSSSSSSECEKKSEIFDCAGGIREEEYEWFNGIRLVREKSYGQCENKLQRIIWSSNCDGVQSYFQLYYKYTYGKSKLVKAETIFNVDTIVERLYLQGWPYYDGYINCVINFKVYCKITNISNAPIWCSRGFTEYYDAPNKMMPQSYAYEEIKPNETYKMPIVMNMCNRIQFDRRGSIYVSLGNKIEKIEFQVVSKYKPEDDCLPY